MSSQPVASSETTQERSERLAEAYGAAWNARDVDAVLALQTEDMVFHLHLEGFDEVTAEAALRELFSFFFDALPDYRADIKRTIVRGDLIILEYALSATLAKPFLLGTETGVPTGALMRVAAVDVMSSVDGKISRKYTYVDGLALRRGLGL